MIERYLRTLFILHSISEKFTETNSAQLQAVVLYNPSGKGKFSVVNNYFGYLNSSNHLSEYFSDERVPGPTHLCDLYVSNGNMLNAHNRYRNCFFGKVAHMQKQLILAYQVHIYDYSKSERLQNYIFVLFIYFILY